MKLGKRFYLPLVSAICLAALGCQNEQVYFDDVPTDDGQGSAGGSSASGGGGSSTTGSGVGGSGATGQRNLTLIPDSAEIVFNAPWTGETNPDGFEVNELYVMDSAGENVTQITHNGKLHEHMAVSPDRKMIAAVRFDDGDTTGDGHISLKDKKTVWVLDLENDEQWPLVPEYDAGWGGLGWSPDSGYIYFSMFKDYQSNIYRIRPDGSDLENITEGIEYQLGADKPGKWISDTSVSFDGQWIAFLYRAWEGPGPFDFVEKTLIGICRVDGTDARLVTDGGPLPPGKIGNFVIGDFDPEFSPDDKYISFQRATDVALNFKVLASNDVWIADLSIPPPNNLVRKLSPDGNPGMHGISDWSMDNRIVFSEWNSADNFIGPVIVNADGSNYHRLENAKGALWVQWIAPVQ